MINWWIGKLLKRLNKQVPKYKNKYIYTGRVEVLGNQDLTLTRRPVPLPGLAECTPLTKKKGLPLLSGNLLF